MNSLAHLLTPIAMRLIALTLLHFLWQGTALATLAYGGMAFCRRASSRYAIALTMLLLMAIAPVDTFLTLRRQDRAMALSSSNSSYTAASISSALVSTPANFARQSNAPACDGVPSYFFWLVEIWFVGVMLFGLRSAGGVLVVERLRRVESKPVRSEILELCLELQNKMGLNRFVRFCESVRLAAPAVVGWLRPAVMLPVTALTGLSEAQLSSVIAHELGHIKRFDSLVNLFQIAIETLLFYHPAVWWLNKRIREERENCCDDMAVAICGSPLTYAHALARMAESTASPRFMMAANSRPLAARVARLLGVGNRAAVVRGADLSLGLLCLSASLIAGVAFIGVARNVHAQTGVQELTDPSQPANAVAPHPVIPASSRRPRLAPGPVSEVAPEVISVSAPVTVPALVARLIPAPGAMPQGASNATPAPASSYIDGLKAAGLDNLTVDQLVSLKIQGVTPEYAKSMHDLGLKADADNLVGMKIQGVTPEYVREMRAVTGESLDGDNLISMKIQGVTPEYVRQIHDLGLKVDADELVGMKIQGVSAEYVREMRKLNINVDSGDLVGMKIQGISPEYVREINALGLHPDAGELIGMKVQGVDVNYLKQMQAAGFKLDVNDAISAKVMGVTPEFVEKARSHGFRDLSLHKLIALKQSGILD